MTRRSKFYGGYYLNTDGSIKKDSYEPELDPISFETINEDQSKRITWNNKNFYNLDGGIKKWLEKNNTDPTNRKNIEFVKTHLLQNPISEDELKKIMRESNSSVESIIDNFSSLSFDTSQLSSDTSDIVVHFHDLFRRPPTVISAARRGTDPNSSVESIIDPRPPPVPRDDRSMNRAAPRRSLRLGPTPRGLKH
jgi:arsenate reductase-like glutaredoxin family protein